MISESAPFEIYALRLNREDEITFDQFIQKALDGYHRHPDQVHNEIIFLLFFGRPEMAYEECKRIVAQRPEAWWPRLTFAFMEAARTNTDKAGRDFAQWVERYPCYAHYYYLSFFYQEENYIQGACDAIRKGLEYPLDNSVYSPDHYNVYYYASNALVFALKNERYDLAAQICDAVLAQLEHECGRFSSAHHWKPKFKKLKQAISSGDPNTIDRWIEYQIWAGSFNPYQDRSTNAVQRIEIGKHIFPSDEEIEARNRPYEEIESLREEW
jgi:tetratricopeptide (TPR) repeat protein